MTFDEYHKKALSTLLSDQAFGDISPQLMAQILGLVGESGEFADKVKKVIRDKNGVISDFDKAEMLKELGDVLWYINSIASLLGSDIAQVAEANLQKVLSRKERGLTKGNGDNR